LPCIWVLCWIYFWCNKTNIWYMKRKKLTLQEIWKYIFLTWFEIAFVGFIAYMSVNPMNYYALAFGGLIFLHALLNYPKIAGCIESRIDPVVPSIFLPSTFFAILAALVAAFIFDGRILNPTSIGFGVCAIGYGICSYVESWYA